MVADGPIEVFGEVNAVPKWVRSLFTSWNSRIFDIWIYGRKRRLYLQKDRYFVDSTSRPVPAHDPIELTDEELLEII